LVQAFLKKWWVEYFKAPNLPLSLTFVEDKPDNYHPLLIDKKKFKQQFRKTYRIELVIKEINFKSKIMQTRTKDSKTFHMLIIKQRRSLRGCIQYLHIDNKTISGEENILQGFKKSLCQFGCTII
jgi:hypothetical protein